MEVKGYNEHPHIAGLPTGWELVNAVEVCTKITDGTHDTPESVKEGVPYIKSVHIKKGAINFDSCLYLSEQDHNRIYSRCNPEVGDLLIVNIGAGNVGDCAYVDVKFEFSMKNIALLKPNREVIDDKYFYHYYKFVQGKVVNRTKTGGAQPFLSLRDLKKIKIIKPPLQEQIKLAKILSVWDEAINITELLLAKSKEQAKSMMQQLLTGKTRFPCFNSKWSEVKIGELLNESRNASQDNDARKRLTVRLNLNGIDKREYRGTEALNSTSHFVRRSGQFIYGKQNFHKGAFGIVPDEFDEYETSQDIPCFDFNGACDPKWFFYYCSQEAFYKRVENHMSGTGSKRLNPKDFYNLVMFMPQINEQKKIVRVLDAAFSNVEIIKEKLQLLQKEKVSLMRQLLTGKSRVKLN